MVVSFFLTFFKIQKNSSSLFVYIASEENIEYVN